MLLGISRFLRWLLSDACQHGPGAPRPQSRVSFVPGLRSGNAAAGGRNVTFPARQYSVNGERRSSALLRPIVDAAATDGVRDADPRGQ